MSKTVYIVSVNIKFISHESPGSFTLVVNRCYARLILKHSALFTTSWCLVLSGGIPGLLTVSDVLLFDVVTGHQAC